MMNIRKAIGMGKEITIHRDRFELIFNGASAVKIPKRKIPAG